MKKWPGTDCLHMCVKYPSVVRDIVKHQVWSVHVVQSQYVVAVWSQEVW